MRLGTLFKSLLREPRTALPALLLLSLGVGGFAWRMALHRSLMLRSLPAPRPDRLVSLWNGVASRPDLRGTPSTGDLQMMRRFPEVFQGVAAWAPANANLGLATPVRVRSALGASPISLLGQVLREALKLTALAGLAGVLLGGALERLCRSVLGAWPDPPLLLAFLALGALVGAALAATFLPALRAAFAAPSIALREE